MPRLWTTLALSLMVVLVPSARAEWTRFRGPNGTGNVSIRDLPLQWSPENFLFRISLPGSGHSSPIVVDNKVILQSATDSRREILCFDAQSGKQLWTQALPGHLSRIHRKSSYASSTPCSDGKHVFSVCWDGDNVSLCCHDLGGKLRWQRDLGKFTSQHGPGFSPVVVDDKVIVNNDQDGTAVVQAFDAVSGKPAWKVERKAFRACYSTPHLMEHQGQKQLIVTSTSGITAYDPATGKELWNYTWSFTGMPLRTVASTLLADDHIVAFAGDGGGARGMIGVKVGGQGDVTASHHGWSRDKGTPYVPTPVAYQGHLYGVLDNGLAFCLEAKTGNEVWLGRLAGPVSASPVLINGKVLVCDEKGDVFFFAADPAGLKIVGRNRLGEPIIATPAVANDRIFIRGEKNLFSIGAKNATSQP